MKALSAYEVVRVWEWGQTRHPIDRSLALLGLADPELSRESARRLSIGQRNRRLLRIREQLMGPALHGYAECPKCGEKLEFQLDTEVITQPEPSSLEYSFQADGFELHCRLPNVEDIASIAGLGAADAARRVLTERCVLELRKDGEPVDRSALPDTLIPAIASAALEADQQTETRLELDCPTCGHEWVALFDIESFFWAELAARAKKLMHDVHVLAEAYGWREVDILSMSGARRHFYISMAG